MGELKDKLFDEVVNETIAEHENLLTFDDKVVRKITGFAINEVRGIIPAGGSFITGILRSSDDFTKGISVSVIDRKVTVDLKVICEYGQNIPRIFQDLVDKLSKVVKEMTGLDVVKVNVHVFDVLTKDEFERQNRKRIEERTELKELTPNTSFRILESEFDQDSDLKFSSYIEPDFKDDDYDDDDDDDYYKDDDEDDDYYKDDDEDDDDDYYKDDDDDEIINFGTEIDFSEKNFKDK